MKQSTKGRYADVYVAPPYSNVASPVDWRIPPIAVYPHMSRYRLIGQMGEGAFSTVYRAIDTKTSHLVALKLVSKSHLNATQHTNVLREASLLRRINHPNVTRLLDFQETPTHYALSLELMTAGEIFHRLVSRVSFSEDVCRHVTVQVAEGLRYLHEEIGVVHRDIKLENLLFESIPAHLLPKDDEDAFLPGVGGAGIGVVKIADFGLSKIVFSSTTKTPCGTVGYTAPEILAARPRYNKGVDMWALGCVLYTLLSGFPPFFDDDPRGLTDKVANGQYAFLSPWFDDISVEAKDLVAGLLVVDPEKRLTIQQVLRHPWMRATVVAPPSVTINEPTVAEPQPTAAPPVRPITPPPQDDWQHISELRDQKCLRTPLESDFRSPLHHMALRTPQASEDRDPGHEHGSSVAPAHPDSAHPSPDYYFVTPPAPLTNNPAPAGPIAALLPLRTPRTPHPVPEGMLTKAVLDAPYQAYKHMAEGKTGNVPEHVGTVRGGIVPRGIVGPSGGGVGNRTNDVPPSDGGRRKGAFELKMDNTSRLLEERRRRAAVVPT
ncbi:hypothetical protein HKX48_009527 [Thoreauomyces humboldtii]|nr:hypothetical protein HKX48_009527 [Thoreauomyces humboldtii]